IQFIKESRIVVAMVGLLNAPVNTRLYKRLRKEDRLLKGFSGDNTDFSMNFIPKMSTEGLINGYKKILGTIYSPREYYQRVIDFLKAHEPMRRHGSSVQIVHLRALLKSMVVLGVVGKERFYYWKLFFWSLIRRPRLFPLAITLAIYGFHFRRVFEQYA
ncbi:MAG TPA: DUF4070 domain-containing protein, partial [Bacteroidota bacterium]|nr:DUF4070 domain-containing protein [Bacteroidota bacterium]